MKKLMTIKVVIFDMNGVITDDEAVHEAAFKEVCKRCGIQLTTQDYQILCRGRTDREGIEAIIEKYGLPDVQAELLVENKSKQYLRLLSGVIKPIPGVLALIKALEQQFRLGLTSSSVRAEVCRVLEYFNITNAFETIVTAEDVQKGKPDPQPYEITAERLGVHPSSCVVIEDSQSGVASAKAAGMFCIGYHNPSGDPHMGMKQDLHQAHMETDDLREISADLIRKMSLQ
jgi:HAD superfamily hydrolase (TIGR01509 family)